ncbi:hypothetical protein CVIRNUC_006037 [Coccomyxa viridis]|uniref:Uncharacterized protein n=1 Tax=Coccomyxa viridis TaxID=1274662 RepID=A0AAV1I7Z2_9CHLO|nr:hypothetical protein CVIRNUC_006037 [Coccomyxa viridis]
MTEPASAPNEAKGEGMDAPAAPEASQPASEAAAGPSAGAAAEEKPTSPAPKAPKEPVDLKQLNVRKYLEATVVSVLLKGMQELAKKRPQDPLDYLADYLKENNPAKKAKTEA